MDYKLHITEQVVEQLDRFIRYLVSNLKNPPAARKLTAIWNQTSISTLNVMIRFCGRKATTKQLSVIFNI